ncbi:MAG: undecaprenyl-diphosphate phosphatase [Oscillospiraceae bacterium]|nr:undecaprenyl-diphosphate phosphatase [Oscillospiraceae bacterium]MBR5723033.1 undecaprenyl-diphosphate phosphatase [Oscillospiraceae bacterium]
MSILDAIIQAIIQGLTEFLPVSSSGHLKLYQAVTGQTVEEGTFLLVILHLGTLVAVCIAFWDTIWALLKEFFVLIKDIFTGKFKWKSMNPERRMLIMLFISLALLVPFYLIKDVFENISLPVLALCFLFTSVELFFASRKRNNKKTAGDITVKDAVVIGLFQCAALFPGVSRSGSTISGGLFSGLEKETAVRYSFVLGIPAILGGCLVELKDLLEGTIEVNVGAAAIGFVVAAVVGILAIKLVQWLIRSDNFVIFSIYTFLVACGTFIYWLVAARG